MAMQGLLRRARPFLPLVQVERADTAVLLAEALHEGGLDVLEIALRTPQALDALSAIRKALPQLCVGAGTVLAPAQFQQAVEAGAQFAVSPGFTGSLAEAAAVNGLPWLPGVMTPSEILHAWQAGFACLKLFPVLAGGASLTLLQSLCAVFPDVQFVPSGGVKAADLADLLALSNVPCAGGSLVCPADVIRAGDFVQIRAWAQQVCSLTA